MPLSAPMRSQMNRTNELRGCHVSYASETRGCNAVSSALPEWVLLEQRTKDGRHDGTIVPMMTMLFKRPR
jgi:hypothetical protein